MIDLIGIEPNPGPPKGATSKQVVVYNQKPKKKIKQKQGNALQRRGAGIDAAIPGRYPTPRTLSMGASLAGYMRCLNDPFNQPPVRPGVLCAVPTGLFSCYLRLPYTVTTTFFSHTFVPWRLNHPFMGSGSAGNPYNYGAQIVNLFPQTTAIVALYEKARLLAAGFRLIPMQNSTNDAGQISSALIPGVRASNVNNFGIITGNTATQGFNEMLSYPETLSSPFKEGASIYWRPQDPNSFVFREATMTDTQSTTNETLQDVPFLMMGLSGIANPCSYIVEMISHFEGTIAAGNAGVIDLQRAPPTSELTALSAADRVFGQGNRTSRPGSYGPFNPRISDSGPQAGGRKSTFWKDALSFGSSVAPLLLELL